MRAYLSLSGIVFGVLVVCALAQGKESSPDTESPRRIVSLDGMWEIAEGTKEKIPAAFDRTVPVPGLVDMAKPEFKEVGLKSKAREAFWYRRSFTVDPQIPAVARLKLNKAMFGAKIILNGKTVGEQKVTFTPLYCDIKDVLQPGENVILIRVGAFPPDEKNSIGWDIEKSRYIPGIFDSVEIILTGAPHIDRLQTVPDIDKSSVTIHVWPSQPTHFVVREARSKKIVGEADGTDKVTIPIPDCRLWSPESPFLYEVTARTSGDELSARFGMRSFRLDPQTGRAMLNGKPYFMRGSNVALYRFFEDPKRENLPWNEAWVRTLHQRCKEMHWNSLRYTIGFPPEFWYRIADEEGILLQDEFPIWLPFTKAGTLHVDELAGYYRDWMQDRWNHPSVVIWDACNESNLPETGKALAKVRGLDFSDRPWENWRHDTKPTDAFEDHPYHFSNAYKTLDVQQVDDGQMGRKPGQPPIIINEYGWLWLNRDGTPTTLTTGLYWNLLGGKSTTEQRRTLYARYMAAETEFWRAKRGAAAVMHFCILSYSRPGGATSDDWIDVKKLEFEPQFFKHVRDAFAPVGVMVDKVRLEYLRGETVPFQAVVYSDLDTRWEGQVRMEFCRDGKPIAEKTMPVALEPWGKTELNWPTVLPSELGSYQFKATLLNTPAGVITSQRDVTVITPEQRKVRQGLAAGKPAKASSTQFNEHRASGAPQAAFDGDNNTRWLSMPGDPPWIAVDLEKPETVSRVELNWDGTNAKAYSIEVSLDGESWKEVYKTENGKGWKEMITFAPIETRWVRLHLQQPASEHQDYNLWELRKNKNYALWEMRVFPK